jgi:hypothetical protein
MTTLHWDGKLAGGFDRYPAFRPGRLGDSLLKNPGLGVGNCTGNLTTFTSHTFFNIDRYVLTHRNHYPEKSYLMKVNTYNTDKTTIQKELIRVSKTANTTGGTQNISLLRRLNKNPPVASCSKAQLSLEQR